MRGAGDGVRHHGLKVTAVVVLALMFAGCDSLRVQEGVYANLTEARDAGAIAKGWVPQGLPSSASDLREGHMPDGRRWGVVTFATADAPAMRMLLNTEVVSNPPTCDPPGRLEWWPRLLHTPIDIDRLHTTDFRLYRGKDGSVFAINWNAGRAYYWSASAKASAG